MASRIMMTPDTMMERASQYDQQADNVGEVITSMDNLLGLLMEEWEGAAAEAYAERFEQLKPSFVQAQQLITEIANSLRSAANTLQDTDSQIAGAFHG